MSHRVYSQRLGWNSVALVMIFWRISKSYEMDLSSCYLAFCLQKNFISS